MTCEEFEKACSDCIEYIDKKTLTPAPISIKLGWMIFSSELAEFLFKDVDELEIDSEV